ncbi:DUF4760 domain-containing protein [Stenotrophomonas indicatrix]|uniref:DUF4760 domain-containing protein n=1 Tax=Stenotrophomonas indicatrix TaxID=2045451 RepID=UPI0028976EB8|nr:hypothetical protein [Stenotrophomonas indicatrix]
MQQVKKDNVIALAWRHVLCPLARHADALSWILFVVFLASVAVTFYMRYLGHGSSESFYSENYSLFWYLSWGLLVASTIGPMFNVFRARNEVPLGVMIGAGVTHVLVFILMSVVVLIQADKAEAVTGLLAAVAGAVMIGIGWVVQHQSSARASRRAHTFSVLTQSRLSAEFQSHVKSRILHYPAGTEISVQDAALFYKDGLSDAEKTLESQLAQDLVRSKDEHHESLRKAHEAALEEVRSKYLAMQSVKYLLNFYEFICAGLRLKELDEMMVSATLSDMAVGIYNDTIHVRRHAQKRQPAAFTELDRRMPKGVWLDAGVPEPVSEQKA